MKRRTFLEWACSSAFGHGVLIGSLFSIAEIAAFLIPDYVHGDLTWGSTLYVTAVFVLLGVAASLLTWYTVTLPLIKRRKGRS